MAIGWTKTTFTFTFLPGYQNSAFANVFPIDVNGDGRPDLVFTPFLGYFVDKSERVEPIKILLNEGHGHFKDATSTFFPHGAPATLGGQSGVIADFNGDGRPDLFLGAFGTDRPCNPGGQNLLLLSSGAHGFVDATNRLPQQADATGSVTAADITGNGPIDIFVLNQYGPFIGTPPDTPASRPYFLMNDGTGHFTPDYNRLPSDIENRIDGYFTSLLFDANGDHHPDLFLGAYQTEKQSVILLNDGTGDFSHATRITIPLPNPTAYVTAVAAADLTGDGDQDLVICYDDGDGTASLHIMMNDSHGNFTDETASRLPSSFHFTGTSAVQLVDLLGNGYMDIVPEDNGPILLNDGTGHFITLPLSFLHPAFQDQKMVFDATGNGRMDILFENLSTLVNGKPGGAFELFSRHDPGRVQISRSSHDFLFGDGKNDVISGLGGHDVIFGGRRNDKLTGGGGNNYLNGGAGNDTIDGGPGHNTLFGGPGADHFVFDSPVNHRNVDTIVDFTPSQGDKIVLSETYFHGIGAIRHLLAASHFVVGAHATTHAQHIIYDPTDGFLYYDQDGSGRHPQVHFATITTGLDLHNTDVLVAA